MLLSDVERAIANNYRREIEEAFCALVLWPGFDEIEDASAARRKSLLEEVCTALEGNTSIMPSDVATIIIDECDGLDEITYGAAASAVLENLPRFRSFLDREG